MCIRDSARAVRAEQLGARAVALAHHVVLVDVGEQRRGRLIQRRVRLRVPKVEKDESNHVCINCSYQQKMLASNSDDKNLYKALARGVDSMRTQIIRKSE